MPADSPVVLITGAGKRIGAALAADLHARNYRVALHYQHSQAEAEALCAKLNATRPDSALSVCADLGERNQRDAVLPKVLAHFGQLNALINNASQFFPSRIGETTDNDWEALFNSNARAPLFLAQAAAPHLRQQRGCIINIADIYGIKPKPQHTVYSMAKAALIMMTQSLALELAPEVRVNAIAPGAILWPAAGVPEAHQQATLAATPLARLGTANELCTAVHFLIEGASFCTGQVLAVDGGRLLR